MTWGLVAVLAIAAGALGWQVSNLSGDVSSLQSRNDELQAALSRAMADLEGARADARRARQALASGSQCPGTGTGAALPNAPLQGPSPGLAPTQPGAARPGQPDQTWAAGAKTGDGGVGWSRKGLGSVPMDERFDAARQRDAERYSPAELAEIDKVFEDGQQSIRTPEGQAKLKDLILRYPDSNRAGCAGANLGSVLMDQGQFDEAATYLEPLTHGNNPSAYSSGELVQVKALYDYGNLLSNKGDAAGAKSAWQQVIDQFPDEHNAMGNSYPAMAKSRMH